MTLPDRLDAAAAAEDDTAFTGALGTWLDHLADAAYHERDAQ